jgi:hypothetical protein
MECLARLLRGVISDKEDLEVTKDALVYFYTR